MKDYYGNPADRYNGRLDWGGDCGDEKKWSKLGDNEEIKATGIDVDWIEGMKKEGIKDDT